MRVVLLCATHRGHVFLRELRQLLPDSHLAVFSFREEPWEPPFLDKIRDLTVSQGGQFFEAKRVGSPQWNEFWESTAFDLMFTVNWRYAIPRMVYQRASRGAFVLHDSLLPRYRGFSPTVWAMLNGETDTGVTLFEISQEIDAGDIVDRRRIAIGPDDTIGVVTERVTEAYVDLLRKNLERLLNGTAPRHPQDHSQATYVCKRMPEDNLIDWRASTESIYNLIRAVGFPYPGAFTYLEGRRIRVWSARRLPNRKTYVGRVPGRVVEVTGEGSAVLTGDGVLFLTRVQLEGGEVVCASDVLKSLDHTLGRSGGR